MRKVLPLFLAAVVFLTPLYPVYAQTSVSQPARPPKPATSSGQITPVMMQKAQGVSDQMLARKEQMATKAAQLRLKLQRFKDKNKATKVENINENLNMVNEKATTRMQDNLTKISQIVGKLKTWIAEQEAAGKDVSALKTALSQVESDWTEAGSAVEGQADNDYTVVVNTEATVKTDAQTARNTLRTDLKAVHDQIVSVRQGLAGVFSLWKGGNSGQ